MQGWEYHAEILGNIWRGPSAGEMTGLLNAASQEGWQLVTAFNMSTGNRVMVLLRRETRPTGRKRRDTWP
jgi:hypothetical protein